ncbi:hypothetical protein LEMLEM_LOCUS7848 [Lemmus lemmus]
MCQMVLFLFGIVLMTVTF